MKKLSSLFVALFSLVWLTGAGWLPLASGAYTAQGVWYDATTTTTRGGQLTGIASSKVGTISFWIKMIAGDGVQTEIVQENTPGNNQFVNRNAANVISVVLANAAGTNILTATGTTTVVAGGAWKHVLASWNLATSVFQLYIEDVNDTPTITVITNDTIDWANVTANWFIFNDPRSSYIADLWFDPTTFNDLSVTAFRRKFITAGLAPVFLGASGQLPTGTSPMMFLTGPFGSWNTNKGTGGNFTTSAGALQAAASNPP